MSKSKAAVGDLVEVQWLDAQGFYNQNIADVKPARAVNIGLLIEIKKTHITLRTGLYPNDKEGCGDYTVIPRGAWISEIKVLKKGEK